MLRLQGGFPGMVEVGRRGKGKVPKLGPFHDCLCHDLHWNGFAIYSIPLINTLWRSKTQMWCSLPITHTINHFPVANQSSMETAMSESASPSSRMSRTPCAAQMTLTVDILSWRMAGLNASWERAAGLWNRRRSETGDRSFFWYIKYTMYHWCTHIRKLHNFKQNCLTTA